MRLVLVPSLRLLFRPRVIGKKHLPVAGPCFIIANHSNLYDGFIINVFLFEPTASVMVEEYFRGGFLAWVFKKIGLVPTRKFQPQATPVRELMRFIKDNRMIIIMPEGERNWDGVTRPTVAATGKLFRRLGLPVYPVIMHNGYLAWPGWARWPRRFKIVVDFRPPLQFTPDMTDEQVAEMVDSAVQWDPQRDMARYSDRVPNGFRPADGITSLIFRCPNCREQGGLKVVRGRYLRCLVCDSCWRVGGDSYLTDIRTGERRSSTDTLRHICGFPRDVRDFGPQGKGLLRAGNIPVYLEVEFPNRIFQGRFDSIMREDRISLIPTGQEETITLPFEAIQSISVEKTHRLQVRVQDCLYDLNLCKKGCALQWTVYLKDMLPHLDRYLSRPMSGHYLKPVTSASPPESSPLKESV